MEKRLVIAERLVSIGELSRQIGHDLRNPLAAIKYSAYFLKKKGENITEDKRNEILQTIELAVEDSNRISA